MQKSSPRRAPTPGPSIARRYTNRDFEIVLECTADAVVFWGTRFPLSALPDKPGPNIPLVRAVQHQIDQRQAHVRPGEPPYRVIVRFKVQPEGLRAYYQAYPLFAPLGLPMIRESLENE
jgi:hypothetical protein